MRVFWTGGIVGSGVAKNRIQDKLGVSKDSIIGGQEE